MFRQHRRRGALFRARRPHATLFRPHRCGFSLHGGLRVPLVLHRHDAPRRNYEAIDGVTVDYPLMWEPIEFRPYVDVVRSWGIAPPPRVCAGVSAQQLRRPLRAPGTARMESTARDAP